MNDPVAFTDHASDRLPYPPGGIRGEPYTSLEIELFHGLHQSQIPFLNKVGEGSVVSPESLCDGNHQPEISEDQLLLGFLNLLV
jgi:hypothetical protein